MILNCAGLDNTVSMDLDIGSVDPGYHTLKAALTAGGLTSAKETNFMYAASMIDSDGDNIPDIWETEHGLDPDNPLDAEEDQDNDGFTNLEEYEGGSDPLDFRSTPIGEMIKIQMDLPAGWSMISLAVKPKSLSASDIFPDAKVIYGFEKGSGYIRIGEDEALEIERGYWVLFYEEQSLTLIGQPVYEYTFTVDRSGWEMIGGCSYPAHFTIDTGKIDLIYRYIPGIGYGCIPATENLEPGKGYWMLFSNITGQAQFHVEAEITDGDPNVLDLSFTSICVKGCPS